MAHSPLKPAQKQAPSAPSHTAAKKPPAPAKPAAAPTPSTPAPVAPGRVDPFFTPDDIDAINRFGTDLATKLEDIDTGLKNLETDTTYQKTQNDTSAKQGSSNAQDDAIGRGIFTSSVKDATLYDIEAQRSLSQKFLDDKLTTARLTAGTQKKILGDAKVAFDTNMATRKANNAAGVNDTNSSAWSAAQAAWAAANPGSIPGGGTPSAPGATGPQKGTAPGTVVSKGTPPAKPPNQSSTQSGNTNGSPKPKATTNAPKKIKYGA